MIPGFTNFPLLDLASTALRSWWTIVAGACLGLAAATLALDRIPPMYMATTTIWVSRQSVPDSVAKTEKFDEMSRRLVFFREAMLSDEYMVELIRRTYTLPDSAEELRALIGGVRSNVAVAISGSARKGLNAFELSYRDTSPQLAALVANTMAELYIAQNEAFRTRSAEASAELIGSMAATARDEFDEIDSELTRFQREHSYETSAFLDSNRKALADSRINLRSVQEQWALADARLLGLRSSPDRPMTLADPERDSEIDPRSRRIAELQMELNALRVRYSERHPDYIRKERELNDVLGGAVVPGPGRSEDEPPVTYVEPPTAASSREIRALEKEQGLLRGQEQQIKKEIAEYQRRIDVTPDVQSDLDDLRRRHSIAKDRYLRLERDAERAETTVELEESEMGVGMEIAESASIPRVPVSPQPLPVSALGAIVGMLIFFGPVLAGALLRPVVVSEGGFGALSEIPVLASLPTIHTPQSQRAARQQVFKNFALASMSCAVLVFAVLFVRLG